jgi:hypothetical protein
MKARTAELIRYGKHDLWEEPEISHNLSFGCRDEKRKRPSFIA